MPWFWQRRAAGRRRAQRHDVPLGARRAASAHASPARRSPRCKPVRVTAHIAQPQVDAPRVREAARARRSASTSTTRTPGRGFREHDDRVRDGRRLHRDRRGDDVVELRRRRACASRPSCSAPSTRCRGTRSTPGSSSSSRARCRGRRAKISSRSRTPRSGRCRSSPSEAAAYGYEAEDRHFVRVFLGKEKPNSRSTTASRS